MKESKRRGKQAWVTVWYVLVVLAGIALAGVAMWEVPWWIDDHYLNDNLKQPVATTVTGVRTALLAIGAGGLAAVGILYTHRTLQHTRERDGEQAELTREGQYTDRYTKAVGQIASANPVEQLGGIYALERIMRDSEKDHITVVEVLAAFVREHAPAPLQPPSTQHRLRLARRRLRVGTPDTTAQRGSLTKRDLWDPHHPAEPVQAALTVLGRRPEGRDEPFRINLAWTDLRGANLDGACLEGAHLSKAHLEKATLIKAHLKGANLTDAHLEWATMDAAHLEGTDLTDAHLEDATMRSAHLEGANLTDARLDGAVMYGAHLEGANLTDAYLWAYLFGAHLDGADLNGTHLELAPDLTADQLVSARPRHSTHLAEGDLGANDAVRARITAVEEKEGRRAPDFR
ncbi:pentapeptide repeat-containing protein [Kitasatospora sp. NPDC059577]|uniref:pentapeptide repeat-containing protein n=1 Tax=Kitasatospora sp. NPDC059577 TaxID=3346873 RepID=UPI0036840CAA